MQESHNTQFRNKSRKVRNFLNNLKSELGFLTDSKTIIFIISDYLKLKKSLKAERLKTKSLEIQLHFRKKK